MGKRTLANVTREQLTDTGMSLRQYLTTWIKMTATPTKEKNPKEKRQTKDLLAMSEAIC